ncbi:hypothetical protein ACFSVM_20390 [Paenibacillus shunpengii]|uniref:Holin n=1 Tax=Paenibacillus shunpengii TaxID=2054424 RepID=A0ABW5SU46_9BACL
MKERVKNPMFVAAVVSFVYQILANNGVAPDMGMWQLGVDLLTYSLMGFGIYSTFNKTENS